MASRSAEATIKGYYYQFDTTILKLLECQNSHESVIVEGIEDIDIVTYNNIETVQCKYLSAKKCTNSEVREPISLMLKHFVSNTLKTIKYTLYAHFENEIPGNEKTINLVQLKDILSYKETDKVTQVKVSKAFHTDNGITDNQLVAFLSCFKLKFGEEFYTQQKKVVGKLKKHFSCTDYESEKLYYNNALKIVIDKAIKKTETDRKISKQEFIDTINCGKVLFNIWFKRYKSHKDYLAEIAQNLKSTKALDTTQTKFIFLGKNIVEADNSELPTVELIQNLINKHYKVGTHLYNAIPPTVIIDADLDEIIEIKKQLLKLGIKFNDGHEHIQFNVDFFNDKPIINRKDKGNKIVKSSYSLKMITKQTFEIFKLNITKCSVFIYFSINDYIYQDFTDTYSQFHDIKYCENNKDISKLIC